MNTEIGIKVENGKIIVCESDAFEENTLKTCEEVDLFINNQKAKLGVKYPVKAEDKIYYKSCVIEPKRNIDLIISKDRLEAKIVITYSNGYTYKLINKPALKHLVLKTEKIEIPCEDKYTVNDIEVLLNSNRICCGIDYDNITRSLEGTDQNGILVAKGIKCIDDIPSRLDILIDTEIKRVENSGKNNIDYRNRLVMPSVNQGDIVAKILPRIDGCDGINIFGKQLKKKSIKDLKDFIGEGCKLINDEVIAERSGRPMFKAKKLVINETLELKTVDIKTGNINFAGNVTVSSRIESGSNIRCGGYFEANGPIDSAKIICNGNSEVRAAIVNSVLLTGAYDIEKIEYLNILKEFNSILECLITTIKTIHEKIPEKPIGQIFKFLLEQRYKKLNVLGIQIVSHNIKTGIVDSDLLEFLRTRLINFGALNIYSFSEIIDFQSIVLNQIDDLNTETMIILNSVINYSQKAVIKATGDIIIKGMGSYQSIIQAFGNITFENENSICRGGSILSEYGNLTFGTIGSLGCIKTTAICKKDDAIICAQIAYAGTIFIIDNKRIVLENHIKNLKVYLNEDMDIIFSGDILM